jgi:hypothetical protein
MNGDQGADVKTRRSGRSRVRCSSLRLNLQHRYLMFFGLGRSFPSAIRTVACPVEVTEALRISESNGIASRGLCRRRACDVAADVYNELLVLYDCREEVAGVELFAARGIHRIFRDEFDAGHGTMEHQP